MSLPKSRYPDKTAQCQFYVEVLRRVEALGPVESAAVVSHLPMDTENYNNVFTIAGEPPLPGGHFRLAEGRFISPSYFQTLRIPLKRGRCFTAQDQGQPPVVIINEAFARQYFGTDDPLRRQLVTTGQDPCRIVGIVGDERVFGLGETTPPLLYLPVAQHGFPAMALVLRTRTNPLSLVIARSSTTLSSSKR